MQEQAPYNGSKGEIVEAQVVEEGDNNAEERAFQRIIQEAGRANIIAHSNNRHFGLIIIVSSDSKSARPQYTACKAIQYSDLT